MSRAIDEPTHPNVARLKVLQEQSFSYLSEALTIDECQDAMQDKAKAIPLYEKGIEALKRGATLEIPVNLMDPSLMRAHRLKEKMQGNLQIAEERYNFLKTSLHLHNLSEKADLEERSNIQRISSTARKPAFEAHDKYARRVAALVSAPKHNNAAPSVSGPKYNITAPVSGPKPNRASQLRFKSRTGHQPGPTSPKPSGNETKGRSEMEDLKRKCSALKGVDPKLTEMILNEVIPRTNNGVKFSDISGQDKAKTALHEMIVLPALRPELFTGLRSPAKGLLMFGPPGNGKTMLARALASESKCNLINISSSSLTSKWVGEGEKLVRALFSVARAIQPVIIFVDEIDSLLSERKAGEHEAMRRIKTEFLLQFEGMLSGTDERIVVVAATNRPQELDDAALRRFTKRVYVQMPDEKARISLVSSLMAKEGSPLSKSDIEKVGRMTDGYTFSDLTNLAKDAAMAPLREISTAVFEKIRPEEMRSLCFQDFKRSAERIRKSLSPESLASFHKWNSEYGDIS